MKGILTLVGGALMMIGLQGCSNDNDPAPIEVDFSLRTTEIPEGNTSQVMDFEISAGVDEDLTIQFAVQEESALFGDDFENVSGQVELLDGVGTIQIPIVGDLYLELTERFVLTLTYEETVQNFFIVINDDDVPGDILSDEAGFYTPDTYPSMVAVWSDEFNGTSLSDAWSYDLGDGCENGPDCGWGNEELQVYTDSEENIRLGDGLLTIEATKVGNDDYFSARIKTQGTEEFQFGRIDIRARMPKGQGLWPALWMLGANIDEVSWPRCGEIDIMELVGHEPEITHGTVHYDNGAGYATSSHGKVLQEGDLSDMFHVYSIVWDENKIEWFLDNEPYKIFVKTVGEEYPFNADFFFIMNVAVGGIWPGNPDETTVFPQRMEVDYVRVFQ